MTLKFNSCGYQWSLSAGFPPARSHEQTEPMFVDALKLAYPPLAKLKLHEIASWIVSRLNHLTSGCLEVEGNFFGHDTNEFGYQVKIRDNADTMQAHGAVVIHADRVYFAALDIEIPDFHSEFVGLLADSPQDLTKCEIVVCVPESKKKRRYGWDGYSLLNY